MSFGSLAPGNEAVRYVGRNLKILIGYGNTHHFTSILPCLRYRTPRLVQAITFCKQKEIIFCLSECFEKKTKKQPPFRMTVSMRNDKPITSPGKYITQEISNTNHGKNITTIKQNRQYSQFYSQCFHNKTVKTKALGRAERGTNPQSRLNPLALTAHHTRGFRHDISQDSPIGGPVCRLRVLRTNEP